MAVHRRVGLDGKGRLLAPDHIQRRAGQQGAHHLVRLVLGLVGDHRQPAAPVMEPLQQRPNPVIDHRIVAAVGQVFRLVPLQKSLVQVLPVRCQRPLAQLFHAVAHHVVILLCGKARLAQAFQGTVHGAADIIDAVYQRAVQVK